MEGKVPGHQTALHRAAMAGNSDVMAALVGGGCAVDLQDRDGNTALHEVSWHGFSQCVKLLVKAGADVHIGNKAGNTALHLASQNDHAQTARLLLLAGSSPDSKNNVGDTCLHVAARYNNVTLVKILLSSLSSVTERNQRGDTALHVAAALNHKKTVQLLLEAGTDGNARNKTHLWILESLKVEWEAEASDMRLLSFGTIVSYETPLLWNHLQLFGSPPVEPSYRVGQGAGKTALDKARDNNHKDVALLLARAPQVHRFMRGRTIRKRRERLTAERRSQSVTRLEALENKDSSSMAGETPSSDPIDSRAFRLVQHQHQDQHQYQDQHQDQHDCHETPVATSSPYRKRRVKDQTMNDKDLRKSKNCLLLKKDGFCDDREELPAQYGNAYQLYTLFRDKDGNIRQALANDGCPYKPLIKKLEVDLQASQQETHLQLLNMQQQVEDKLLTMEHRHRHQMKMMDMMNRERAAAGRKEMIYRLEKSVAEGKEEALMTQAAVSHDLKRWCMSQLKDLDIHIPAKARYYKLLSSPSLEQSEADTDPESRPLLSVGSDSSTSLATYVNIQPSKSTQGGGHTVPERMGSRKYFGMKVDRSPDDYENTALFPLPATHTSGILLGSEHPYWQPPGVQDSSTVVPLCGKGFSSSSSSSSQSSMSNWGPLRFRQQGPANDRQQRNKLLSGHRRTLIHADCTRTLEFFIDRPDEPTFSQERNNLHAMEVTQRFFETVSLQLERWYERKIMEVEKQTEIRVQQDRTELLQRISTLEEELQRLRSNENAES